MIHSKAIDIYNTFTKEELKKLSDYIRSPYHNRNKHLIMLVDALAMSHSQTSLSYDDKVFKDIFSPIHTNSNNVKKLLSNFLELERQFLAQQRFDSKLFMKRIFLCKELDDRNLNSFFHSELKLLEDYELPANANDINSRQKASIDTLVIHHNLSNIKQLNFVDHFFNRSLHNSLYFLELIIKDFGNVASLRSTNCVPDKLSVAELFLYNFDSNKFKNDLSKNGIPVPLFDFILNLINMIKFPKMDSYYFEAKEIFFNSFRNVTNINHEYVFSCISIFMTHSVKQSEMGVEKFIKEPFMICKLNAMLIRRFYFEDYVFNSDNFLFHVWHSLPLDPDWTEWFIYVFICKLPASDRLNIWNTSFALLEFKRKNFQKCLEYSSKINSHTIGELAMAQLKICIFQSYYELELFDSAISHVDAFKHYLNRTTILNDYYKIKYLELINYCHQLLNIRLCVVTQDVNKTIHLKKKIEESSILFDKCWFIEKIQCIQSNCT